MLVVGTTVIKKPPQNLTISQLSHFSSKKLLKCLKCHQHLFDFTLTSVLGFAKDYLTASLWPTASRWPICGILVLLFSDKLSVGGITNELKSAHLNM